MIPAHNEEQRLPEALTSLGAYLKTQSYTSEIVVAENGSSDGTSEVAHSFAKKIDNLVVLTDAQPGKGRAVRRGMLAAKGGFRLLCDADFSMPVEQISRFIPASAGEWDVAIGSREHPESEVICPGGRRGSGRIFNLLTRMFVLRGFRDTQCGFKCFSAAAAEIIFQRSRLDGYCFDVEALYIARRHGLRIVEVPITWVYDADTRVQVFRDGRRMVADLLRIRANTLAGKYT